MRLQSISSSISPLSFTRRGPRVSSMTVVFHQWLLPFALVLVELAVIARILLRPHRDPASRIAWLAVVALLPVLGILAYLLLGEVNIGRRRLERMRAVLAGLRKDVANSAEAVVLERHDNLFRLGQSISGFHPVGGNTGQLTPHSNATIDAMVADI